MRKVILSVAPVSAASAENDPRAIARDVYECYLAGACMVHLHCRDKNGALTDDISLLRETVALIREYCPIIIEISTGGVSGLTIQQRCAVCDHDWVELNSLNIGSVNLGEHAYVNPIADVRYCVERILSAGKLPEIEVFEIGMLNTARALADSFPFPRPLFFAFVLGHEGAMPASAKALDLMLDAHNAFFPNDRTLWGLTEARRADWSLVEYALNKGASAIRLGFEDSPLLSPDRAAKTNAPLIAHAKTLLEQLSLAPATPAEARSMLSPPR